MGINYDNINGYEQYEYEAFMPNFFSPKIEKETKNSNNELGAKNKEYSKLNNNIENSNISKSRKSTIDNDDIDNGKNTKNKSSDKIKNIFLNPINSPFFSQKREEIIYSNDDYHLEINEKDDIRKKYYSKLIYKNIWSPGIKTKAHNSLFIFDWDDTLFPTSFFINKDKEVFNEENLSEELKKLFSELEEIVVNILNFAINKGDVYIITNSNFSWFSYSSYKYYPNLKNILKKIKIISARDEYEDMYPGENKIWKEKAFLKLGNEINNNLVTNIICFGDSLIELEAGKTLASQLNNSFCKTIKFKENPEFEDLIKQLNLISNQLDYIYSKPKNLSITIEQKY